MVKEDAPGLLRKRLMMPSWKGEQITFSGNTDCYQPIERKLQLTRRCLEVMTEFRNPVWIISKNSLVTRDIDLLAPLAQINAVGTTISVTSLDNDLCGDLDRVPRGRRRAWRRLQN